MNKNKLIVFFTCLFASYVFYCWHHPDEHFQIYEFMYRRWTNDSTLKMAWEYDFKIRPIIQPFILYCFYEIYKFLSFNDPFIFSFIIRIFTTFLVFYTILNLNNVLIKKLPEYIHSKFILISFIPWWIIFHATKFSSEVFSGVLFVWAFIFFNRFQKSNKLIHLIICGSLFGLSFDARFQIIFMVLGFALWLIVIQKIKIKQILILGFSFMFLIGIELLLEKWYYSTWSCSFYSYFYFNIIKGVANNFGTSPWWWYIFEITLGLMPIVGFVILFSIISIMLWDKSNFIIWLIIPFIFFHSIISHKEPRFLIPTMFWVPFLVCYGIDLIYKKNKIKNSFISKKLINKLWIIFIVINFTILLKLMLFENKKPELNILKYAYYNKNKNLTLLVDNGYPSVFLLNFYNQSKLKLETLITNNKKNLDSFLDNNKNKNILIMCESNREVYNAIYERKNIEINVVSSQYPFWVVKYFNINNWYARSGNPIVLEIKN